jgi:hypothetical protein
MASAPITQSITQFIAAFVIEADGMEPFAGGDAKSD